MYFGTVHPPRLKDVRKIAARKRQSVDIAPVGFVVGEAASMSICNFTMLMAVAAASSPLVAVTAAAAVEGLLHVAHRQHAESDGHVPLDLQLRKPCVTP